MPQLKPSFICDIRSSLEKSRFTPEDFKIELPDTGCTLARITFVHKPEYFLALFEEEKQEQVTIEQKYLMSSRTERIQHVIYSVRTVPGSFKTQSDTEINKLDGVLELIPK